MGVVTSGKGLSIAYLQARIRTLQVRLRGSDPLGQRDRILEQVRALHVQILKEQK